MASLDKKKCVPCEGGAQPLTIHDARTLLPELQADWMIDENPPMKLQRTFKFEDFKQAIAFVDKVAKIAEQEGHHPNIHISFNKVKLVVYTHSIKGLHENDFILAAKIDNLIK